MAGNTKDESLKISENNKENSPFLRLPPELRNRVYELALGGNTVRPINFENNREGVRRGPGVPYRFLSLLQVSRTIYTETRCLPYQLNALELVNSEIKMNHWHIMDLLSEEQRGLFKRLIISFTGSLDVWRLHPNDPAELWIQDFEVHDAIRNLHGKFPGVNELHIKVFIPSWVRRRGKVNPVWNQIFEAFKGRIDQLVEEAYGERPFKIAIVACG
ncbi:hypothetical protein DM02DRAFT_624814 [Periconia macrospinosa]|uniref:Uncharacterized protein n=1 Tax=Periconia macrospinosa TaxID=97972 RepID=A0A2V1E4D1_9PLEO|nr:hypothetical protein DM02DRAFT_624814 [Periconia macrospinosa]